MALVLLEYVAEHFSNLIYDHILNKIGPKLLTKELLHIFKSELDNITYRLDILLHHKLETCKVFLYDALMILIKDSTHEEGKQRLHKAYIDSVEAFVTVPNVSDKLEAVASVINCEYLKFFILTSNSEVDIQREFIQFTHLCFNHLERLNKLSDIVHAVDVQHKGKKEKIGGTLNKRVKLLTEVLNLHFCTNIIIMQTDLYFLNDGDFIISDKTINHGLLLFFCPPKKRFIRFLQNIIEVLNFISITEPNFLNFHTRAKFNNEYSLLDVFQHLSSKCESKQMKVSEQLEKKFYLLFNEIFKKVYSRLDVFYKMKGLPHFKEPQVMQTPIYTLYEYVKSELRKEKSASVTSCELENKDIASSPNTSEIHLPIY